MTRLPVALLLAVVSVGAGCGATATTGDSGDEVTTAVTTTAAGCREENSAEVLATLKTSGFAPHSTLIVREDGGAWASAGPAFGGPRCYAVPEAKLRELRAALESADLETLHHSYDGTTAGPDGMVVEIVTQTVTANGVSVSADHPGGVPDRLDRLLDVLREIEGLVIEHGAG